MLGFFAKLGVWQAGVAADLVWLVALSAVASAIGAYYYLRIVFFMYFGQEGTQLETGRSPLLWGLLMASAAVMVLGVINLFGVDGMAQAAAASLVN